MLLLSKTYNLSVTMTNISEMLILQGQSTKKKKDNQNKTEQYFSTMSRSTKRKKEDMTNISKET